MSEDALRAEMRLSAIEYLLSKLYAAEFKSVGYTQDLVAAAHAQFMDDARKQPIAKGLDPALSDLASGLWEEELERLLAYQRTMMGQA